MENPLSVHDGMLRHLMKNTATVARSARPAHPKGRPVALLNTSTVEQLVSPITSNPTPRLPPSTSPSSSSVDPSQLATSCSATDSELLTNLAQAAIQPGVCSAPLQPDSSSNRSYYVTKRPEPGSPPELAPIQHNKMYATFRKVPSPAISKQLPTISSPARVASPPVNSGSASCDEQGLLPSGKMHSTLALPSLRSAFEGRKRSRSLVLSQQTKSMECPPGKTTWAVASSSTHKLSARKSDATNGPFSSSSPTESTVSRSTTAALKLSLDQRRRAIELSRQRALAATTKSACRRHHTAFQKLLQTEQRRKVQRITDFSECESVPPSQMQTSNGISSVSTSADLPTYVVEQNDSTTPVADDATFPAIQKAAYLEEKSFEMQQFDVPPTANDPIDSTHRSSESLRPDDTTPNLPFGEEPKSTSPHEISPPSVHDNTSLAPLISESFAINELTQVSSASGQCSPCGSSSSNSGDRMAYTEPERSSLKTDSEHWLHSVPRRSSEICGSGVRAATPHRHCDGEPHTLSAANVSRKYASKHALYTNSRSSTSNPRSVYRSTFADPSLQSFRKVRPAAHKCRVTPDVYSTPEWLGTERSLEEESERLSSCNVDEVEVEGYPEDITFLEQYGETPDDIYEDGAWDSEGDANIRSSYSQPLDTRRWLDRSHLTRSRCASSHIHPGHSHRLHNRSVLRARPSSPLSSCHSGRCSNHLLSHSLMDSTDLDELNRNIIDLQSGIRRLAMLTSSRTSEAELQTEKALFPGQQTPVHLLNSTTSLGGSPRATWSDRPKLRDLGTCAVSTSASVSSNLPPDASESPLPHNRVRGTALKSTATTTTPSLDLVSSAEADTDLRPMQVDSATAEASSLRQSSPGSGGREERRPDQKIFFVAFEESDPQRMQRKFDQLEARRAAEKAAAARILESRRSQMREAKASGGAIHQAKATDREKRAVTPHLNGASKEPPITPSQNPYPVRSGSATLSRSEVNLSSAVRDPRTRWPHVADNHKLTPSQRLTGKSDGKLGAETPTSGPRGSGDGEAVETSERDDGDSVLSRYPLKPTKSGQLNGVKFEGRLHSGLSLSSLHRLSAADSSSTSSTFNVAHSAHPKLFVKPKAKSNRMVIVNAIGHACLAGAVNEPMKQATLKELAATEGTHFMILFRDSRCQYRAVYSFDLELEELRLICGTGPRRITHEMANRFFKYNSGGKQFTEITSTNHLSPVVDAITIHDSLWTKGGAQSAALNLLSGRL